MTSTRAISIVGTGLWKNVMRLSRWNRVLFPIRDPRSRKENERERIMKIHLSEMRSREERESDRERRERQRRRSVISRERARALKPSPSDSRSFVLDQQEVNDKSTSDTLEKERNAVRHWASSLRGERKKKTAGKTKRERERGSSLRFRRFSLLFKSLEEKSQFFFFEIAGPSGRKRRRRGGKTIRSRDRLPGTFLFPLTVSTSSFFFLFSTFQTLQLLVVKWRGAIPTENLVPRWKVWPAKSANPSLLLAHLLRSAKKQRNCHLFPWALGKSAGFLEDRRRRRRRRREQTRTCQSCRWRVTCIRRHLVARDDSDLREMTRRKRWVSFLSSFSLSLFPCFPTSFC